MYIVEFTHSGSNSDDVDYIATIQQGHLGINKRMERYHQGTVGQILKTT